MGIDNRDYNRGPSSWEGDSYRSEGTPGFFSVSDGYVTKRIIVMTVIVFIAQVAFQSLQLTELTDWLNFSLPAVSHGQVWRLLTYAFCHDPKDIMHILFNMLFLWWFGKALENMYGGREFLIFYLTAAVASAFVYTGIALATSQINPMIGASGCVMAIMMVFACHFPKQKVLLMMVIPIPVWVLVAGYVIFDTLPVLAALSGQAPMDKVAHGAHLGGLLFGFLYYRFGWKLSQFRIPQPSINLKNKFGPRSKIRLYDPDNSTANEKLKEQVDLLLKKITDEGEASLTDKERKFLDDASRKFRKSQ